MGRRKRRRVETEKCHSILVTVRSRLDLQHQTTLALPEEKRRRDGPRLQASCDS